MAFPGLLERVASIRAAIARHQAVGGWSHPVTIVAVTKTHGPEAVQAAHAAGLADVGENRVQEALGKMAALPDLPVQWHLIGSLQRNKVRQAVGRFALVHSVDRIDLVDEFARRLMPGQRQRVLLEVNCGNEPQKGGVAPVDFPALLEAALRVEGLVVEGVMTMAPFTTDVAVQRAVFRRLRQLRDDAEAAGARLPVLSMGMSVDFAAAVEEGATMVRLGTILFGERGT